MHGLQQLGINKINKEKYCHLIGIATDGALVNISVALIWLFADIQITDILEENQADTSSRSNMNTIVCKCMLFFEIINNQQYTCYSYQVTNTYYK